ncbi:MAG: Nif3-like dinuclear metal center hexameric protein [Candidatus Hodarchaeales archaeon]|jgi:hypothetical protein
MNTNDIVEIALKLVEMTELPADSAVHVPGENIEKILYGIDIGTTELLYAKNHGYDCVIAHHPVCLINQWEVFWRHLDQLVSKGVPRKKAEKIIQKKIFGFKFGLHARNYDAIPSFARMIGIPFLNIHCPSDELGRRLITNSIDKFVGSSGNSTLNEMIIHLESKFIEFQNAKTRIEIAKGDKDDLLGKWIFSHGAFTNGGIDIANCYFQNKINTVIYIHISPPELFQILRLEEGQLLITGHLASDSIGINPFLDHLEKEGFQITAVGGLIR